MEHPTSGHADVGRDDLAICSGGYELKVGHRRAGRDPFA
jgi:hypothetical protein